MHLAILTRRDKNVDSPHFVLCEGNSLELALLRLGLCGKLDTGRFRIVSGVDLTGLRIMRFLPSITFWVC